MSRRILYVLLAFTPVSFAFTDRPHVGSTVQTSSGAIIGHAARNRTQVFEYLGIPYAKPPVGALRFAAPQSYSSSNIFNASTYVCVPLSAKALPSGWPEPVWLPSMSG